ncbi:hypothetical protein AX774_g1962 [Zancudomyces culisetae]|uniref:Uncharacterized protein n=1 Tax=Zancudomyces culisetae TaxID=1213189 RepID=A0A1R1PU77_ZANCU|nr:hypothetical protein AX774_g1962 [Zancudomyces culisetae]|eukprot:OMH84518.1 hypothetical protein AX774_g1962 [Zancudomyces culisetae]
MSVALFPFKPPFTAPFMIDVELFVSVSLNPCPKNRKISSTSTFPLLFNMSIPAGFNTFVDSMTSTPRRYIYGLRHPLYFSGVGTPFTSPSTPK